MSVRPSGGRSLKPTSTSWIRLQPWLTSPCPHRHGGTLARGARSWTKPFTNPPNLEWTMNSPSEQLRDRDLRQREIVPPDKLARCHAVVIGVGAIGRQVSLQLAAVGVPLLVLYDHDVVAVENLAAQGYRPDQLGRNKADA